MESLVAQLNGKAATAMDQESRLKLQDALRGAADSLETPGDLTLRLINSGLEIAAIRSGCDLGLFTALVESNGPLSVEKLAAASGAEPLLLGRILRYLASIRIVTETSKDRFTSNKTTEALTDPRIQGSIYYIYNISTPSFQALPDFLLETKYQSRPEGSKHAWQKAMNTDLDFFPWVKQYPEKLKTFQQLMSIPREGDWLDVVNLGEEVSSIWPDRALIVDVGGNIGHQCARIKAKYPNLPGRIIVQDLEETVKAAPPIAGVEFMVHDFFNPQPVKGAKFYYLRTIFHDWPDDKAEEILKNLIPAMEVDSRILIDDMTLPNTGVHWWSACADLTMYTMHGAMERNLDQWRTLLDKTGLRLLDIKTYMPVMQKSVIVTALK